MVVYNLLPASQFLYGMGNDQAGDYVSLLGMSVISNGMRECFDFSQRQLAAPAEKHKIARDSASCE